MGRRSVPGDEPRETSLSNVITGLGGGVDESGDRIVAADGLLQAQLVAWAAPVSRDPVWQAAHGTGSQGPA